MSTQAALDNYRALLGKVESKFHEVAARYPSEFACRKGCHSCCAPGLTVSTIEHASIREYLVANPEIVLRLEALEIENPHQGSRCSFLDREGACQIYEARPLVCRSHGAPIAFKNESGEKAHDVCPLNFTGLELETLPAAEFMDIDTVNTILGLINRQWEVATGEASTERVPLRVEAILGTALPE